MKRALRGIHALALDRIAYRLWRYNPVALIRLYRHHAFDRRFGVRTTGYGDLRYEPTPEPAFARTMEALESEAGELRNLVFVDIGSGKGKVVLLASMRPFKRVIGVELYEEFHELARENLTTFRGERRSGPVELVLEDAANFELPREPIAIFFFNPFPLPILEKVLGNIEHSLDADPRPLYVVFYAPILFRDSPWDRRRIFDRSARLEVVVATREFTLYRGRRPSIMTG